MTAPTPMPEDVVALARAWWIEDEVAAGALRSWAEHTWDAMAAGSEPTSEFTTCVVVAAAVLMSGALAERDARIKAEALRGATDAWTQGEWANHMVHASDPVQIRIGSANRFGEWLRARADRIEAGEQP